MTERPGAAEEGFLTRIGQTVMLHTGGDREEARNRLVDLWEELGEHGDPYHRCILAHYLADTEADPSAELEWDLRALTAADASLAEEESAAAGDPQRARAVRSFYPSLYLNLAADLWKLGHATAARRELDRARSALAALGGDVDAQGVRAAVERLELRLTRSGPEGTPPTG